MSEQVQVLVLGEIRDQLKRLVEIMEALTFEGKTSLNVETGTVAVRIQNDKINVRKVSSNY